MFKIPEGISALTLRLLTLGEEGSQQLMEQLKATVPNGSFGIQYEYVQDILDNSTVYSDLTESDITIICLCSDLSTDALETLESCRQAAEKSRYTLVFFPVFQSGHGERTKKHSTMLKHLEQLSQLVDTLVLVPTHQAFVPVEIASAIPLLLSGSSLIGIDSADIKYVLTDTEHLDRELQQGVYLAQFENNTDQDGIQAVSAKLAEEINTISQIPLSHCVASIGFSPSSQCSLQDLTSSADTLYSTICKPNATRVFSSPILSLDSGDEEILWIVCIAGKLELSLDTLSRMALGLSA